MKVLILSNAPLSCDNAFGNSFSNIFLGMKGLEFANVYCRYGKPNHDLIKRYFQITEKSLLKNLKNKKYPSGQEVVATKQPDFLTHPEESLFNHARKRRLRLYFWLRDFIWKVGRWKSPELKKFIDDFSPDIIFQPVYYSLYLNDIALFIQEYTKAPMACYVSDDVYTLKQFSLSLFYWIDRFRIRRKIKKLIKKCSLLYVISDIQKKEYSECFKKECSILTKGADFSGLPLLKKEYKKPFKLVYTGNIGNNRWKTLKWIGEAIESINTTGVHARLLVYTLTPVTNRVKKALSRNSNVLFMSGISPDRIPDIQNDADILVHVEPLDTKGELQVRHSFSTKLVDYFYAARCIFAAGSMRTASMDYLAKNNAAIVAASKEEISRKIQQLINDPDLIRRYSEKSWGCGKQNHQIDVIQNKLYKDLKFLAQKAHYENSAN